MCKKVFVNPTAYKKWPTSTVRICTKTRTAEIEDFSSFSDICGPEESRTPDLFIANEAFWPAELQALFRIWWAHQESNLGPQSYQDCALTS